MNNKEKYIENIKKISQLLEENKTIKELNEGIDLDERIKIPSKKIREVAEIKKQYHINDIIINETIRRNLCYLLEYLDLQQYMYINFNIWGPVKTIYLKHAQIVYASFMETLTIETARTIRKKCSDCPNKQKCKMYINKHEKGNFRQALDKLVSINAITLNEEDVNSMKQLYDSRNMIHLFTQEDNEYTNDKYTEEDCDKYDELIEKLALNIYTNATPLYNDLSCCEKHE